MTKTRAAWVPAETQWIERLRDGIVVRIRPLSPDDGPRERAFLSRLSPEGRAYRFLGLVKRVDDDVAQALTCVDPACEVALGAFAPAADGETEVGVAHYRASPDGTHCDCSVTVDPFWQKLGLGRALMRHLIEVARARGIRRMYAVDAAGHAGAHTLAEHLGFHSRPDPEDPFVTTFELVLD